MVSPPLKAAIAAVLLAGAPAAAWAQNPAPAKPAPSRGSAPAGCGSCDTGAGDPVKVPAIQPTKAAAPVRTAAADPPPARMPPPIDMLSPSAPLGPKERHAVTLVRRWRARRVMPAMGPRGEVRFLYGATMPTVVCAPLQICNIALQPGEIVTKVDVGDPVMWSVSPGISGSGPGQVTHLIVKPRDAGLHTTMDVETNRRTYAIRLISTRYSYMPLVAFNYPEDQAAQWAAYQQTVGYELPDSYRNSCEGGSWIGYSISGDTPSWRPLGAWTNGRKTCIEFPAAMAYGGAPVLEKIDNDGGLFRAPSTQVVNYRKDANYYIYDGALDRAALISGVGGAQTRVVLTREGAP
jgi:P-type conjugative transfer protein TrbG